MRCGNLRGFSRTFIFLKRKELINRRVSQGTNWIRGEHRSFRRTDLSKGLRSSPASCVLRPGYWVLGTLSTVALAKVDGDGGSDGGCVLGTGYWVLGTAVYFIFPALHPGPILMPMEDMSFFTSSDPHFGQVSLIVSISFTLRTLSKLCSHLPHSNSYKGIVASLQFQVPGSRFRETLYTSAPVHQCTGSLRADSIFPSSFHQPLV